MKNTSGRPQNEDSDGGAETHESKTTVLDITVEQMAILKRKWCTKISSRDECAKICNTELIWM